MRNLNKKSVGLLIALSMFSLLGCGLGGSGDSGTNNASSYSFTNAASSESTDNPVTPTEDLPSESETEKASVFDKPINEVYTISNIESANLAIDIPADGANYLLNIVNNNPLGRKISVISDTKASARLSCVGESANPFTALTNDRSEAMKASLDARLDFIRATQAKTGNTCVMASRASLNNISDHSGEVVGKEYAIYTGTIDVNPMVTLSRCKLVAMTEHVKFFVDQENHGYSSYDPAQMEDWVTGKKGGFSFANIFDTYAYGNVSGYSVLKDNFGTVADIDNDGKLSILFSPILQVWRSGLEGLFPEETMIPDSGDYANLPALPEYRDLVIVGPIRHGTENYIKQRILSNMVHETQHAINFSNRAYSGNSYTPGYNATCFADELGFDEGCSVAAEALFRRAWGEAGLSTLYDSKTGGVGSEYTGNDSRFDYYLRESNSVGNVFPFNGNNFNYSQDYGRNGLFVLYLHDRFGKDDFKRLIQQGWQGNKLVDTIPAILCGNMTTTLDDLQRDWHFALQNEYLRTMQNANGEFMTSNVRYKYQDWLKLTSVNKSINANSSYLSPKYGIMYLLKPETANVDGNNYRFYVKSVDNTTLNDLEVNIIKLPNN